MSFTAFTAAALNEVKVAEDLVVNDFNGHIGDIDLGAPMTFVAEKYKLVLTEAGQMDLIATIAHIIHVCQTGANRPVTQGDIDMAMPVVALRINTYSLLALIASTEIDISYRGADVISHVRFAEAAGHMDASVITTARRIYTLVREDGTARAAVGSNAFLLPLALIANKRHRDEEKGHNWYTAEASTAGSTASKLLAMAGKRKDAFATFMALHGHDVFHFLPYTVMEQAADGLTGTNRVAIRNPFIYGGEDVQHQMLDTVIDVGEACTDRYSGSALGVSSLILGVNYIKFFVTQVSIKVPGIRFAQIDLAATALLRNLQRDDLERESIIEARTALAFTIAFTVGFCCAFSEIEDDIRKHQSIVRFADANVAGKATGLAIGKNVKDMDIDNDAMLEVLVEVVNNMSEGMRNAANRTNGADDPEIPAPAAAAVDA